MPLLRRYLPILDWGATYTGKTLTNDLTGATSTASEPGLSHD